MLQRNDSWYNPPCGVLFMVVVVVGGDVMRFDRFHTLPFKTSTETGFMIVIPLQHARASVLLSASQTATLVLKPRSVENLCPGSKSTSAAPPFISRPITAVKIMMSIRIG